MSQIQFNTLKCPYCHDSIVSSTPNSGCGSCLAWHHTGCLQELGRCANCSAASPLKVTLDAHFKEALAAHHREEAARKATLCGKGMGCAAKGELKVFGEEICLTHANSRIWLASYWRWAGLAMALVPLILCVFAYREAPELMYMGVPMAAILLTLSEVARRRANSMKAELRRAELVLESAKSEQGEPALSVDVSSAPTLKVQRGVKA